MDAIFKHNIAANWKVDKDKAFWKTQILGPHSGPCHMEQFPELNVHFN